MRAEDSTTLRALHRQLGPASKTKVVVVILSGGPVDSSQPAEVMGSGMIGAVVAAWQPGEAGKVKRPAPDRNPTNSSAMMGPALSYRQESFRFGVSSDQK